MSVDIAPLAGEPSAAGKETFAPKLIELNALLFRIEKRKTGFNTLVAWFMTNDPDRDTAGITAQREYHQQIAIIDESKPPEDPDEPFVRRTIRYHLIGAAISMKYLSFLHPQGSSLDDAESALSVLPPLEKEPSATTSESLKEKIVELNQLLFQIEKKGTSLEFLTAWFKRGNKDHLQAGYIALVEYQRLSIVDVDNTPADPEPFIRCELRHHLIGAAIGMKNLSILHPQRLGLADAESALSTLKP